MLRKIIDGKSLEISQKNVYEGVSFSKVTSLQCSDCNFAIKRTHRRFVLEYVTKTCCLETTKSKSFFEKKVNRGPTSSSSCSPVVYNPQFYQKSGAHVRPSCRSAESSNIFTGKCLWWRLFFTKDASLEFIPAISLKRDSNAEVFLYGFFTITPFKLSENFLRDIFAKHFLTKSQASNLTVANLMEITCLKKIYKISF